MNCSFFTSAFYTAKGYEELYFQLVGEGPLSVKLLQVRILKENSGGDFWLKQGEAALCWPQLETPRVVGQLFRILVSPPPLGQVASPAPPKFYL